MDAYESQRESLIRRIYNINEKDFEAVALAVFDFQYTFNPLYRKYCDLLPSGSDVKSLSSIPCMPISFFRDHIVQTGTWTAQQVFRSSGTTQAVVSRHFVRDLEWYHRIAARCFSACFTEVADYTWIGLLPSYLERPDSSLVDMVQFFMQASHAPGNQFHLAPDRDFLARLQLLANDHTPAMMIGVSFALLDLFEMPNVPVWDELMVIETGGMKGRREEMTREELHARMRRLYPALRITSEYGMTEMTSQAYLVNGTFTPGPTLRIAIRDISDPLGEIKYQQRGAINIIDLANLDTCAFVATDDIGILYTDHTFEVLGRLDQSEVRGCNLMYT